MNHLYDSDSISHLFSKFFQQVPPKSTCIFSIARGGSSHVGFFPQRLEFSGFTSTVRSWWDPRHSWLSLWRRWFFFSSMDGKPWRTPSSYTVYIYIRSMVKNLSEYEGQCRVLSFGPMTKAKSPFSEKKRVKVKIWKCWVLLKIPLKWWVKIVNIQTLFNMIYSISQFQSYIVMQTQATVQWLLPTDEFWIAAGDLHSGPQRFLEVFGEDPQFFHMLAWWPNGADQFACFFGLQNLNDALVIYLRPSDSKQLKSWYQAFRVSNRELWWIF